MLAKISFCNCAFNIHPFYQSSDSSDYYSTGTKTYFPSNDHLKFFINSLEIISNKEERHF